MEQFDFYKEFYFKELDNRNEINSSLSLPIGLITALIAGIFYLLTNFDYKYSVAITTLFVIQIIFSIAFLVASIYNLIKAYSDFHKGYDYAILADTADLDNYYQQLKAFYASNTALPDSSKQEFETYVLNEMIKNTGDNQKNNKKKTKFRYNCERHLINSFVAISLCLPVFCIDYSFKAEKKEPIEVRIDTSKTIPINLNSKENRNFILEIKDSVLMPQSSNTTTTSTVPKPTPPASQLIKEGHDPRPQA